MTGHQSVAELAADAAEAIRSLNHATFPGTESTPGGLTYPTDAYAVLGSLSALTARLPQLLTQLDRFLTREVDACRMVIDGGEFTGDPPAATAVASYWLEHAGALAGQLGRALDAAQQAVASMSATDPDDAC